MIMDGPQVTLSSIKSHYLMEGDAQKRVADRMREMLDRGEQPTGKLPL